MFGPRIRSWKQFATGVLAGAALVGALAAGLVYGASSGESEARVVALKHEDGRVEVGLQQRDIGGAWGDTQRPDARFLAPNADVGRLYHSSPVALAAAADESITTSLRRADFAALGHAAAQNHQAGAKLICLSLDRYDEGRGAYCDALRDAHPDDVTVYALSNPGEVAALVGANAEALASGASLTTASTQAFVVAREVLAGLGMTGVNVTIPPVSADAVNAGVGRDDLFCLVHHGGPDDIFWGIARGTAWLAAESDRMNLRVVRGATGAEQAAGIRQCIADGAAGIASTLADPEATVPAMREAREAQIKVVTFNSGSDVALEAGAYVHVGLDDAAAGRMAGERFNADGITGTVVCIVHEANNVGLDQRCAGAAETYHGEVQTINIGGMSREQAMATLGPALAAPGLGAILTLNNLTAYQIIFARQTFNIDAPHATFGLDLLIVQHLAQGNMSFAINDQPELQGYLAVSTMELLHRYPPPAGGAVSTLLIHPIVWSQEDALRFLSEQTAAQ